FFPVSSVSPRGGYLFRLSCSHLVEPHARGFYGVERFLLQFDWARPFGGACERAARDGAMIRALSLLQRFERRGVLRLPVEPSREPADGIALGLTRAFDPEYVSCFFAPRPGYPLPITFDGFDAAGHGNATDTERSGEHGVKGPQRHGDTE